MEQMRKPFEGVGNIIRFNGPILVSAFSIAASLQFLAIYFDDYSLLLRVGSSLVFGATLISLLASFYIYDCSSLYSLCWLNELGISVTENVINVHSGFDEFSPLLIDKYPEANFSILDFYDPVKHTEPSISRARKMYPPFPNTVKVRTDQIPFDNGTVNGVFVILSAHEIRSQIERITFFKELNRALCFNGEIVVVEHERDLLNFIVYNFGALHFFSNLTWRNTFKSAGLKIIKIRKITPFLTVTVLTK